MSRAQDLPIHLDWRAVGLPAGGDSRWRQALQVVLQALEGLREEASDGEEAGALRAEA